MTDLTHSNDTPPISVKHADNWVDVLHIQAKEYPDKIAFSFLSKGEAITHAITYAELNERAKALAIDVLRASNPGDRVMLLMPNGIDYIVGFFACLYAGVIAVTAYPPLHKKRDWGRINSLLIDSEPCLVLSDLKHKEKVTVWLNENAPTCKLITVGDEDLSLAKHWQKPNVSGVSVAYLQYSSGSTGSPKGVMLSHQNLLHNVRLSSHVYGVKPNHGLVSWLPMYHDMGLIGSVLNPIYNGSPAWLMPPAIALQKPFLWLKAISDFKAAFSAGPNFIYEHCVNRITDKQKEMLDLSSWVCSINGAEPIQSKTLIDFNNAFEVCGLPRTTLTPSYGMAETSLFVTAIPVASEFSSVRLNKAELLSGNVVPDNGGIAVVSSGYINDEMNVEIVDPLTNQALASDRVGEIWIQGDSVSTGYWNNRKATKEAFDFSLSRDNGLTDDGFVRSGDIGFIQGNNLYVCGRSKEVIIVHGRNHFPQDIEMTAQGVSDILNAHGGAAFSIEADNDGPQRTVLVQELSRHGLRQDSYDDLILAIRQAVAETHEISLAAILLIAPISIAKTTSGKIQRVMCREQYLSESLNVVVEWHADEVNEDVATQTKQLNDVAQCSILIAGNQQSIERWVLYWIAQRMNISVESLDRSQELVSTGLDSVDGMTLVHELSEQLKLSLNAELVWQYPTIGALSQYLAQANTKVDESALMLEGEI